MPLFPQCKDCPVSVQELRGGGGDNNYLVMISNYKCNLWDLKVLALSSGPTMSSHLQSFNQCIGQMPPAININVRGNNYVFVLSTPTSYTAWMATAFIVHYESISLT